MEILCTVKEFVEIIKGCDAAIKNGHCNTCPLAELCGQDEIDQFVKAKNILGDSEEKGGNLVEIVRCRECVHAREIEDENIKRQFDDGVLFCARHRGSSFAEGSAVYGHEYCNEGRRKTKGT